jgi:spore maturation protein CgeB
MKITVNQLRKIIREEIEKTVRLNEESSLYPYVDDEEKQRIESKLNKITKYHNLNGEANTETMANALVSYYKDVPHIMGAESFTDSAVFTGLKYMFPNIKGDTWRIAAGMADSKAWTLSRPTPQDNPVGLKAAFVKP